MRKVTNNYYLSVEGETEKWYFNHLQNLINNSDKASHKVIFNIKISKSITKYAKSTTVIYPSKFFHICDYESNDESHRIQFDNILNELRNVKKINRNINYKLGYSNFSFELWIILHKGKCAKHFSHRRQYLEKINEFYGENFESLTSYKEERNFNKILNQITLDDVIQAVKNGKEIRDINIKDSSQNYRKNGNFEYYTENPDMTIYECVGQVLSECELL